MEQKWWQPFSCLSNLSEVFREFKSRWYWGDLRGLFPGWIIWRI